MSSPSFLLKGLISGRPKEVYYMVEDRFRKETAPVTNTSKNSRGLSTNIDFICNKCYASKTTM